MGLLLQPQSSAVGSGSRFLQVGSLALDRGRAGGLGTDRIRWRSSSCGCRAVSAPEQDGRGGGREKAVSKRNLDRFGESKVFLRAASCPSQVGLGPKSRSLRSRFRSIDVDQPGNLGRKREASETPGFC